MLRTAQYRAIIVDEGIGVFFVPTGKAKKLRAWDEAKLVVKAWDRIEAFAREHRAPFLAHVRRNGQVYKLWRSGSRP